MSAQLILAVVSLVAIFRQGTDVGLVFNMSSLMVVTVAYGGKLLWAELALIWSDTWVNPLMDLKITSFVELLGAKDGFTDGLVFSHVPATYKLPGNLVRSLWLILIFFLFVWPLGSKFVFSRELIKVFNRFAGLENIVVNMRLVYHAAVVDAHVCKLFEEVVGGDGVRLWFKDFGM